MKPMLTISTPNTRPITDRVRKHKDGSVLLSIAEDRMCKLNGVGALTWMILEEMQGNLTLDEIVFALKEEFDAINAEGELHYEVPRDQLRTDTARFLTKMGSMGLVQMLRDSDGQELYSIKDDVSATTSSPERVVNDSQDLDTCEEPKENIRLSKRETFSALLGLLAFDLLLKFAGFQALIKKVEQWPTATPRTTDREVCRCVRGMVDRAQMYYPKKAMCLQHAAVVTCLLRRRGVPAEMVLAAREFPPAAHAWTEVLNKVVSDSPSVKAKYRELRRL
jgi:hypothetical protein